MSVIDDYLSTLEKSQASQLQKIRNIIVKTVPEAMEVITYGMPGFKYKGKYLIAFASFKDHLSIFPGSEAVEKFGDRLSDFKLSKGTIQFTVDKPVPTKTLKEIISFRVKQIDKV